MSKNIINKLIEHNVCFSVCVSLNRFKNPCVDNVSKTYFVIIHSNQLEKVRNIDIKGFHRNRDFYDIYEYGLSTTNIKCFKDLSDKYFEKVIHNKYGRIYELKDNSFKEDYVKNKISNNFINLLNGHKRSKRNNKVVFGKVHAELS